MEKIFEGVHRFRETVFPEQQQLFERLARKQSPQALFITCSDSRVNPNLITQTEPGDLFLLRNAGNIVPPYGAASGGGEEATIEYAVSVLKLRHIILCGHSNCGAMHALLHSEKARDLPAVRAWFAHAEATRRIVRDAYPALPSDALERLAVAQNVLVQIENLKTHPSVASALARRELNVYGWIYTIETGEVLTYDFNLRRFVPLTEDPPAPLPAPAIVAEDHRH
ncbi:MAG TPA: carbonic anhydrase [Gemmataceae bacterium]|nr:carbonic anhydrase [Gemmataceae bacterium]